MNEYLVKELNKCEDAVIDALLIMTSKSADIWDNSNILQHVVEAGNHLIFAVEKIKAAKRILNGELQ
jgi:hypothetical protein